MLPLQPAPVRERLSEFVEGWKCITNDPYVLSIVTKGYRLHFYESIPSMRDPLRNNLSSGARRNSGHAGTNIPYAPEERSDRGASEFPWVLLKSIPGTQSFRRVASSNRFKKSERSHFCTSFLYVHYKLSSEYPAKRRLRVQRDLQDAYFHVPIHPSSRKYLRFAFENKVYQFRVLPFGLNTAPQIFTLLGAQVTGYLHRLGILVIPYLDV